MLSRSQIYGNKLPVIVVYDFEIGLVLPIKALFMPVLNIINYTSSAIFFNSKANKNKG
jgi:hypothetical protein